MNQPTDREVIREKRRIETAICHYCNLPFNCLTTQHDRDYGWIAKKCHHCGGAFNHTLALKEEE